MRSNRTTLRHKTTTRTHNVTTLRHQEPLRLRHKRTP